MISTIHPAILHNNDQAGRRSLLFRDSRYDGRANNNRFSYPSEVADGEALGVVVVASEKRRGEARQKGRGGCGRQSKE